MIVTHAVPAVNERVARNRNAAVDTDHDGDASEDIQRGQALPPRRRPLCRRRRRRRRSRRARPAAASLDVSVALAAICWVRCCRAAVDASGEVDALRRRCCHGRRSSYFASLARGEHSRSRG